jgi:hypothetical protein
MQGPSSPYAVLGLSAGAGRDEIERAYRRLIKLHHPDRDGGDAERASEINRAYAELRRAGQDTDRQTAAPPRRPRSRRARRRRRRLRERQARSQVWSVLTLGLCGLLLLQAEPLSDDLTAGWYGFEQAVEPVFSGSGQRRSEPTAIDALLSEAAIAAAVRQAESLSAAGNEDALSEQSRACHRDLRATPTIEMLDRCVAFDIAAAALADYDRAGDDGRFGAPEMTARQMNSGSLLSGDYLAIERRLDRVRSIVGMSLRRAPPELQTPVVPQEPGTAVPALP